MQDHMANPHIEINERDEEILEILKEEEKVTPLLVRRLTGYDKGDVNTTLSKFARNGWIQVRVRGLYQFEEDPREQSE